MPLGIIIGYNKPDKVHRLKSDGTPACGARSYYRVTPLTSNTYTGRHNSICGSCFRTFDVTVTDQGRDVVR